ncbi:MAG: thiamine pyrophosphate-binding protein, partial [Chloroflexi bacterium]
AGVGIEAAAAQDELLARVETWQIPVAVTPKTKGHFPESHPLFAGCFTAYGDNPLRQALSECDLVIGAGLDSVDFVTSAWEINVPVINFNLAGADDPALKPLAAIDGDLGKLLTMIRRYRQPDATGLERAAHLRTQIAKALRTPFPHKPGTIKLHDFIAALQEAAPEKTAVTVDVGAFKLVFLQQWQTEQPKSLFVSNGLSAMGYALPGALAIKLAQPERPVAAIAGDGALLMYAGELETVARCGKPLVILVVVDEALSLIRLKQLRNDVPIHGTEFGHTNFAALAQAFGLAYRLVDGVETAVSTLQNAFHLQNPVLVEVRIDNIEYDHFK